MAQQILVLGALGNVGAEVVNVLSTAGVNTRAADLFPNKIQQRFGDRVEAVLFDYAKPETFAPTFDGIRKVFVMRPPQISNIRKFMILLPWKLPDPPGCSTWFSFR